MENKKFNNSPNKRVFISRSCAVVGVVLAYTPSGVMVLVEERSNRMMDEAGKVGVPCGYLDWDETLYEAMVREVYEETSLYIPDYKKHIIFDNNKQPFSIKDNPKTDKHQNVSHIFLTVFDFNGSQESMDAFPYGINSYKNREVNWAGWMKMLDFYNTKQDYEWAFNHDETIESAMKFFNKNFEYKKYGK